MRTRQAIFGVVLLVVSMFGGCTCVRPFDVPEYIEIAPNETAFLVPLEGDVGTQVKLDSAEKVAEMKVATKRVQITHRWKQTGRSWWLFGNDRGQWIGTVRLIRVNRSPVTREWTTEAKTGTAKNDEGIWAESRDSVGFSTGFSVTAMVTEADAALFLYRYPQEPPTESVKDEDGKERVVATGSRLARVMDKEIRARVQSIVAETAAAYDMSDLRGKKTEIVQALRKDIIPFFAVRGITITIVGMFGGLAYENPKVQTSIDGVFIAQREKEVTKAILEAQRDKNAQIEMEAKAIANKEREVARGIADGKRAVLQVAKEAASDPVFLELRKLEVEEARIQKWDGKYPEYLMQMGSSGSMLTLMLNMPVKAQK